MLTRIHNIPKLLSCPFEILILACHWTRLIKKNVQYFKHINRRTFNIHTLSWQFEILNQVCHWTNNMDIATGI